MKKLLLILLCLPFIGLGVLVDQVILVKPQMLSRYHIYITAYLFSVLTLVLAYLISSIYKRLNSNPQQRNIKIIYCVFAILTPLIIFLNYVFFIKPQLRLGPVTDLFFSQLTLVLIPSFLNYILTGFILYRLKKIIITLNRPLRIIVQFILACFLFLISILVFFYFF